MGSNWGPMLRDTRTTRYRHKLLVRERELMLRAHNPKVAGANPAPAIEADQGVGLAKALQTGRLRAKATTRWPRREGPERPECSRKCKHAVVEVDRMTKRDGALLAEVQRDAPDGNVPLADTLRKLIALGGQAGSVQLREWASRELRGYQGSDVELPS
jgi:AbiTii